MGWEERRGRRYYYRKRRVAGRVVSQYVGTGPAAEALAAVDTARRARDVADRMLAREQEQRAQEALRQAAAEEATLDRIIADLTRATLLVAGWHTHKGLWRRRRA